MNIAALKQLSKQMKKDEREQQFRQPLRSEPCKSTKQAMLSYDSMTKAEKIRFKKVINNQNKF
jgi:hypothetical protein